MNDETRNPTSEDSTASAAGLRAQTAAWREFTLARPPTDPRSLDLWIQHAAGLILFEKVRAAGLATLDTSASTEVRTAVELAVDATIYALMMLIDGVTGGLRGNDHEIALSFIVELKNEGNVVRRLDLRDGDGFCMGFHAWKEGDYGEIPVIEASASETA